MSNRPPLSVDSPFEKDFSKESLGTQHDSFEKNHALSSVSLKTPSEQTFPITGRSDRDSKPPKVSESVYLPNGKLNTSYLSKTAEILLQSKETQLARKIYQTLKNDSDSTAIGLYGLAQCDLQSQQLESARKHLEEAIAYQPTLEGYRKLAQIYSELNLLVRAAEALERAAQWRGHSKETLFDLYHACGNAYSRAKNFEKAAIYFQHALDLQPNSAEMKSSLGSVWIQKGQFDVAQRHFEDAIAADSRCASAHFGMGLCYSSQGDHRRAYDAYVQSLNLQIQQPTALYQLVKSAYQIKSYAAAARLVAEYIDTSPSHPHLLFTLAGLQFHLSRMDAAQETLRKLFALQADHPGAKELQELIQKQSKRIPSTQGGQLP